MIRDNFLPDAVLFCRRQIHILEEIGCQLESFVPDNNTRLFLQVLCYILDPSWNTLHNFLQLSHTEPIKCLMKGFTHPSHLVQRLFKLLEPRNNGLIRRNQLLKNQLKLREIALLIRQSPRIPVLPSLPVFQRVVLRRLLVSKWRWSGGEPVRFK